MMLTICTSFEHNITTVVFLEVIEKVDFRFSSLKFWNTSNNDHVCSAIYFEDINMAHTYKIYIEYTRTVVAGWVA